MYNNHIIKTGNYKEMVKKVYIPDYSDYLYITDTPDEARSLRDSNKAVLIEKTPENEEESFDGFMFFIEGDEDAEAGYYKEIFERVLEIPREIATDGEISLFELVPSDFDFVCGLSELPSVTEYMPPFGPGADGIDSFTTYTKNSYLLYGYGFYLIVAGGEKAGLVGFGAGEEEGTFEIGFALAPEFRGRKIADRAVKAATGYLRKEFPEAHICARCHKENSASIGLCRKHGIEVISF